jgi:cysteine synthase
MARSTSPRKVALIEREVGRCEFVDAAGEVYDVAREIATGAAGSIVTLMCDLADRYSDTFGDDAWLATHGMDPTPFVAEAAASWRSLGGA